MNNTPNAWAIRENTILCIPSHAPRRNQGQALASRNFGILTSKFCFGVRECQSGPQAQPKWGHRPTPLLFWAHLDSLCVVYIAHLHNITKQLDDGLFIKKEVGETNSIYHINLNPRRPTHCIRAYELVSKTAPIGYLFLFVTGYL